MRRDLLTASRCFASSVFSVCCGAVWLPVRASARPCPNVTLSAGLLRMHAFCSHRSLLFWSATCESRVTMQTVQLSFILFILGKVNIPVHVQDCFMPAYGASLGPGQIIILIQPGQSIKRSVSRTLSDP